MTLEQLQTRLAAYVAAETKILRGQEYVIGEGQTARRLRRADLVEVRKAITDLSNEIAALEAATSGKRRVLYLRPGC